MLWLQESIAEASLHVWRGSFCCGPDSYQRQCSSCMHFLGLFSFFLMENFSCTHCQTTRTKFSFTIYLANDHFPPLSWKGRVWYWLFWERVVETGWQSLYFSFEKISLLPQMLYSFWLCMCAAKSLQSCPTLYNAMDCSPPGSSVHGILQARILERVAIPFSRVSSWPRGLNLGIEPMSLCLLHWQVGSLWLLLLLSCFSRVWLCETP